jgi:hypothetical protein
VAHTIQKGNARRVFVGNWKDTDPMADIGVDSGIILKWILNTLDAKA